MRVVDAHGISSIVKVGASSVSRFVLSPASPRVDGRITWSSWIDEQLLGAAQHFTRRPGLTRAVYRELQPGAMAHLRYGPGMGQALDPSTICAE